MLNSIGFMLLYISATVAFHNAIAPYISLHLIRAVRVAFTVLLLTHNMPSVHSHQSPHTLRCRMYRNHFLLALLLLCTSLLLSSGIGWSMARWLPHTSNYTDALLNGTLASPLSTHTHLPAILLTAVFGAIDEELLYRVLCYRVWQSVTHAVRAAQLSPAHAAPHTPKPTRFIACSTALFTGAHIGLPLSAVLHALGASIVLSAFYARYRSVLLTIVLHATVNIIAIALYYFGAVKW